ncbi:MAG TPA: alpha/beta hydrolase-fold protein [Anaerolineae bacterium]
MKFIVSLARVATLLALLSLAGCAELARSPIPIPTRTNTPTPTATRPPTWTLTPDPTATPEPTPTAFLPPTPGCSGTTGRIEASQFPSTILPAGQAAYIIYFPPCYDTRLRYPVVYLMHGSPNFDERHWLDLGLKEALDPTILSRRVPPFLVVLPRGDINGTFGNTSGGEGSWEQVMVDELIPYIDTVYNTLGSKEGRAIGGISRGAVWALEIAFRHPDLFAAVGGHSSALAVSLAPPIFDPIAIVQTDQADAIKGMRILLDSGDTDWALQQTAELHALLDQRGIANTFTVGRGSHVAAYWSSQMENYVDFYGSTFAGLIGASVTP